MCSWHLIEPFINICLLEIVVYCQFSHICLYKVTWKKLESLLFKGDVVKFLNFFIIKSILLEIIVCY